MAIIGRVLEAQGLRVGIIAQPDWHSAEPFARSAARGCSSASPPATWTRWSIATPPTGACAATMPTPPAAPAAQRPDRAVIVYAQRAREAYREVPIVIGGIEASLRRIAHFDYWSREGAPLDPARCQGRPARLRQWRAPDHARSRSAWPPASRIGELRDIRGTAFAPADRPGAWIEIDSTHLDAPGPIDPPPDPYAMSRRGAHEAAAAATARRARDDRSVRFARRVRNADRERSVIRMPALRAGAADPVLYAHASRILHLESNPGNARALVQRHGDQDVWLNPPPIPLTHGGDGLDLRAAVPAPAASRATARRNDSGLQDDPLLGGDPARLLRRLHVLLDHRARGPHHPEPLGGLGAARDRARSATRCRASPA